MRPRERFAWPARVLLLVPAAVFLLAAAAAPALAVSYGSPAPMASASTLDLSTASNATLGTFLTGPDGHTLYWLSTDTATGATCTGGCLAAWPPLTVAAGGSVSGPSGVGGTFTTFTRADNGQTQVAFDGHPLYYFVHDTAAGQTNGAGIAAFGGTWHAAVVAAASTAAPSASSAPSASATATSSATSLPPTSTTAPGSTDAPAAPPLAAGLLLVVVGAVVAGSLARRVGRARR